MLLTGLFGAVDEPPGVLLAAGLGVAAFAQPLFYLAFVFGALRFVPERR